MDLDNIGQNMNTRVVFKEPRGMIRWIQLTFAIIAFSTVVDFNTTIGIAITCPSQGTTTSTTPPPPNLAPSVSPSASSSSTTSTTSTTTAAPSQQPSMAPLQQVKITHPKLVITYPFDFSQGVIFTDCPTINNTYTHTPKLDGSPQFFVMTGVLSLIYASSSLTIYLLFSNIYDSLPVVPVADLIITSILCLFWFIGSSSFSSGVSLLKSTVTFTPIQQALCQSTITPDHCLQEDMPSWKALNVGLVSGFTSFFLWGAGIWFVYKETHFHTPRDQFGPR